MLPEWFFLPSFTPATVRCCLTCLISPICFSGSSLMVTGWWTQLWESTCSLTPPWNPSSKSRWCPMDLSCRSCRLLVQASHPRRKCGSVTKPAMLWLRPFPRSVALAGENAFLFSLWLARVLMRAAGLSFSSAKPSAGWSLCRRDPAMLRYWGVVNPGVAPVGAALPTH